MTQKETDQNTNQDSADVPAPDNLPEDITNDPVTDKAVEDISSNVTYPSLENGSKAGDQTSRDPDNLKAKLGRFFSSWLGTKKGRTWTYLAVFILLAAAFGIQSSRYYILNAYGARSSVMLSVTDGNTQLPLQNATVIIGGQKGYSTKSGNVTIHNIKLGKQQLSISRPGFASVKLQIVIGWGGNPLGNYKLKEVGQQYIINVLDYLTGKTISSAEAASNGFNAMSDSNGKITLTFSGSQNGPIPVTLTANGYNSQNLELNSTLPVSVSMVPSGKDVFVNKSSGLYDLYTCTLDGQNSQLLLAGTPTETSNISLDVSPNNSEVAMVSTRDNVLDTNGNLEQTMALVSTSDGSVVTLDHAEQIHILGWAGDYVVYQEQTATNPSLYNVISYNYVTSSRNQLVSTPQLSGTLMANGIFYFAEPDSSTGTPGGFYSIHPDASGLQTILNMGVTTILRSDYTAVNLQTANSWYSYTLGTSSAAQMSSIPTNYSNRSYINNSANTYSAWINSTDTSNQLVVFNISSSQDSNIAAGTGAEYPIWWINSDDLVYRTQSNGSGSDYILNVTGGTPKKITDISNTDSASAGS